LDALFGHIIAPAAGASKKTKSEKDAGPTPMIKVTKFIIADTNAVGFNTAKFEYTFEYTPIRTY